MSMMSSDGGACDTNLNHCDSLIILRSLFDHCSSKTRVKEYIHTFNVLVSLKILTRHDDYVIEQLEKFKKDKQSKRNQKRGIPFQL